MKILIKNLKLYTILGLVAISLFAACSKDEYYVDGGLANPKYDGTMLDYFDDKPRQFDTIAQIIRLAGMEEQFKTAEMTFFAPSDNAIRRLIGSYTNGGLNRTLFDLNLDTIVDLSDVRPEIWKFYLDRLIFSGKHLLADYPQIDFDLQNVYPGQNYISAANTIANIGVVFNDARSADGQSVLKYLGYRQINFTPFYNNSTLVNGGNAIKVSSSDIQPTNGVIHVLNYTMHSQFSSLNYEILEQIIASRR